MSSEDRLRALSRDERIALCRDVMENLSDLVEGEAPPDFCERVEHFLGDCEPYHAYRNTLEATIKLMRECGEKEPCLSAEAEDVFRKAVEGARRRIQEDQD
jgi:hypothetical protein